MQRIICDQLVRCMEMHNHDVVVNRNNPKNEQAMKTCVEILIKNGRIPVITAQSQETMADYKIEVSKSDMLKDWWTHMPYIGLSFVKNEQVEEYATISAKCAA